MTHVNTPIHRLLYSPQTPRGAGCDHLNAVGGLHVSYLAPSADLSLDLIRPETQLFLVDWELAHLHLYE